jgi:hypothetical protein
MPLLHLIGGWLHHAGRFRYPDLDRMDANQEIFGRIMDDDEFGSLVRDWMLRKVYSWLNAE